MAKRERIEDLGAIKELCREIHLMDDSPFEHCQRKCCDFHEKYIGEENMEALCWSLRKLHDIIDRISELATGDEVDE